MRGVNRVILVGNIGRDAELREMSNGSHLSSFSIATSETWKDKNGERAEHTEWHNVVAFGKLAEVCSKYIKKGMRVYVEGKIHSRKWKDSDGADRINYDIHAEKVQMLESKKEEVAEEIPF